MDTHFPHSNVFYHMVCLIFTVIAQINPEYCLEIYEYLPLTHTYCPMKIDTFLEFVKKNCPPCPSTPKDKNGIKILFPIDLYFDFEDVVNRRGFLLYFIQICGIKEMWFTIKENVYISWPIEYTIASGIKLQISFFVKAGTSLRFTFSHPDKDFDSESFKGMKSMFHLCRDKWCKPKRCLYGSSRGLLKDFFLKSTTKTEPNLFNFCGYKIIKTLKNDKDVHKLELPKVLIRENLLPLLWAKGIFGKMIDDEEDETDFLEI